MISMGVPVRRALTTAVVATLLTGGLLVAAPAATAATCTAPRPVPASCTAPTVRSITTNPRAATIPPDTKVTVTVVYNDPDDLVYYADFRTTTTTNVGRGFGLHAGQFTTVTAEFMNYGAVPPGPQAVRVSTVLVNGLKIDGLPPVVNDVSTSYTLNYRPYLSLWRDSSAKKTRFYGNMTRPAGQGNKILIQFKAKGTKKFVTKTIAKTTANNGRYTTKKLRLDKAGSWRARFAGKAYVIATNSPVVKVKRSR